MNTKRFHLAVYRAPAPLPHRSVSERAALAQAEVSGRRNAVGVRIPAVGRAILGYRRETITYYMTFGHDETKDDVGRWHTQRE